MNHVPSSTPLPASAGSIPAAFHSRRQVAYVVLFDGVPLLISILVVSAFPSLRPRSYDLLVFVTMWLVTGLGVTVGYHRLFTHQAFKCGTAVKMVLGLAGSMAAPGPVISWVSTHRKHHQVSDKDGDPHSPHLHGAGWRGKLRGILHAQFGWLTRHDFPNPLTYARDLLADPVAVRINRLYLKAVMAGIILPALGSQFFEVGWQSFATCLLWGGLIRIAVLHQIISSVNSICHMFGSRPFNTSEQSRNNALLAIPTVGEAWHNNHHRFPSSAYLGLRWWEVDIGGWLVALLKRSGLIWDVVDARRKLFASKGKKGQDIL